MQIRTLSTCKMATNKRRIGSSSTFVRMCCVICLFAVLYSVSQVSANPVVDNINDNDDVDDDKITPELEELLLKKKKRFDCPLCDSSVYSYCSDKLLHDACCCLSPYETNLPLQCKFADCSFLHANSCQEHKLITACCCNHLAYTSA